VKIRPSTSVTFGHPTVVPMGSKTWDALRIALAAQESTRKGREVDLPN